MVGVAKTDAEFKEEIKEKTNGEYEVLGEYVNSYNKILVKHVKCEYEYLVRPLNLLQGSGCPRCSKRVRWTTESYKKEVETITNGEWVILDEYKGSRQLITVQHTPCGKTKRYLPCTVLQGIKCTKCSNEKGGTKDE